MSQQYNALPLVNRSSEYFEPPSPRERPARAHAPEMEPLQQGRTLSPVRPFAGAALADEGPSRHSYASSGTGSAPTEDYPSIYALNQGGSPQAPSARDSSFYAFNYHDDPNTPHEYAGSPPIGSKSASPPMETSPYLNEKHTEYASPRASRRKAIVAGSIVAGLLVIVAVAVGLGVGLTKNKSHTTSADVAAGTGSSSSSAASPSSSSSPSASKGSLAISGGDGSNVTTIDGQSTFTYQNTFGGFWYYDPSNPFANNAQCQSFTPALNSSFNYGSDLIRGVNVGGWLVPEPFIVPSLFEKYLNSDPVAVDEWTLSQNMRADTSSGGGIQQLANHYDTFITEHDFAEIAAAGLNYVRIPIGYWAIETRGDEPFLAKTSWQYFLKAIAWARKYGLRINLDFHALPGSQNGWNHSGKLGSINVLNGPMGYANAQRSLDYIRIIAEFISQPEYSPVVTMFGVTNEPVGSTIGFPNLASYYVQAYNLVRTASGIGEGHGPFISYHEGFFGLQQWVGFLEGGDRTGLDIHPYMCFNGQSADNYTQRLSLPCATWATNQNNSLKQYGLTVAGEFSNAINDCGLWVNGVNLGTRYEGTFTGSWPVIGSCAPWTAWQNWDDAMKESIKQWAMRSMSALQNYFFWTWKVGNSTASGTVESPQWSYQLGLQNGWMPTDPRAADGLCANTDPFTPPLQPWQTGGAGAGQIPASATSAYPWPPTSIPNAGFQTVVADLPSYTPTGTLVTLPPPSMTGAASSVAAGDGWENPSDTAMMAVAIATCSYLDPWIGPTAPPSPLCSGGAKREVVKRAPAPAVTPAPSRKH